MSIAPPVGAMSRYLTRLVSSKTYMNVREAGKKFTEFLPTPLRHVAKRAEETARMALAPVNTSTGTFFEEMGFYYIGPIDGHNLDHLLPVLRNAKLTDHDGPILIHAITHKGKGYLPAETSADKMHGVVKFDVITGAQSKGKIGAPSYTKVFAQSLMNEAAKDDKIVAITAAMPSGTGLDLFEREYPDRCFDVGIAEQHAVTFAAGLAAEGFKPFCTIYSTFLQRAYDQVVHDVAIQNLPVRFALLVHDLGKGTTPASEWPRHVAHEQRGVPLIDALCSRLRVPSECHDLARLVSRFHTDVHRALELRPATVLKLIEGNDALRRPERFAQMLQACELDARGRLGLEGRPYPQRMLLQVALDAARSVDAGAIARASARERIADDVRRARLDAVTTAIGAFRPG
jgi:hypothetical protein